MFIEVNGVNLFYETQGSGRPLILLHGNGETHAIFDVVIPMLAEHFTIYALDSRMHGQSTLKCAISYELMATDVLQFINLLALDKPFIYGFSDGGIVALLLASRHSERLSGIMVSGANMIPSGLKTSCIAIMRANYILKRSPLLRMMLCEPYISAAMLMRISIPALVLAGENDMVRTEHTLALAALIPGAQLRILTGENHSSYVIHSPRLYSLILEFIDSLNRTAAQAMSTAVQSE